MKNVNLLLLLLLLFNVNLIAQEEKPKNKTSNKKVEKINSKELDNRSEILQDFDYKGQGIYELREGKEITLTHLKKEHYKPYLIVTDKNISKVFLFDLDNLNNHKYLKDEMDNEENILSKQKHIIIIKNINEVEELILDLSTKKKFPKPFILKKIRAIQEHEHEHK